MTICRCNVSGTVAWRGSSSKCFRIGNKWQKICIWPLGMGKGSLTGDPVLIDEFGQHVVCLLTLGVEQYAHSNDVQENRNGSSVQRNMGDRFSMAYQSRWHRCLVSLSRLRRSCVDQIASSVNLLLSIYSVVVMEVDSWEPGWPTAAPEIDEYRRQPAW